MALQPLLAGGVWVDCRSGGQGVDEVSAKARGRGRCGGFHDERYEACKGLDDGVGNRSAMVDS